MQLPAGFIISTFPSPVLWLIRPAHKHTITQYTHIGSSSPHRDLWLSSISPFIAPQRLFSLRIFWGHKYFTDIHRGSLWIFNVQQRNGGSYMNPVPT